MNFLHDKLTYSILPFWWEKSKASEEFGFLYTEVVQVDLVEMPDGAVDLRQ